VDTEHVLFAYTTFPSLATSVIAFSIWGCLIRGLFSMFCVPVITMISLWFAGEKILPSTSFDLLQRSLGQSVLTISVSCLALGLLIKDTRSRPFFSEPPVPPGIFPYIPRNAALVHQVSFSLSLLVPACSATRASLRCSFGLKLRFEFCCQVHNYCFRF
jgi:hypothetical protein